jgi:hypothetical protein
MILVWFLLLTLLFTINSPQDAKIETKPLDLFDDDSSFIKKKEQSKSCVPKITNTKVGNERLMDVEKSPHVNTSCSHTVQQEQDDIGLDMDNDLDLLDLYNHHEATAQQQLPRKRLKRMTDSVEAIRQKSTTREAIEIQDSSGSDSDCLQILDISPTNHHVGNGVNSERQKPSRLKPLFIEEDGSTITTRTTPILPSKTVTHSNRSNNVSPVSTSSLSPPSRNGSDDSDNDAHYQQGRTIAEEDTIDLDEDEIKSCSDDWLKKEIQGKGTGAKWRYGWMLEISAVFTLFSLCSAKTIAMMKKEQLARLVKQRTSVVSGIDSRKRPNVNTSRNTHHPPQQKKYQSMNH